MAQQEQRLELTIDVDETSSSKIAFRDIKEQDRDVIKDLFIQSFPVRYDEEFYDSLVKGVHKKRKLYTLVGANRDNDECVAAMTCTIKPVRKEDETISLLTDMDMECCYIMTLAVNSDYRRKGLATKLIENVINHAKKRQKCGVVYLHVITYNEIAMKFYQQNGFERRGKVRSFYTINGAKHDAYIYARYINGTLPPETQVEDGFTFGSLKSLWRAIVDTLSSLFS